MGTALNSFTPKGVEHGTATAERPDVQPPRQGKDKPRLSDAATERRKRSKREPISTDPNKLTDDPQFSTDAWYWSQVEAKR